MGSSFLCLGRRLGPIYTSYLIIRYSAIIPTILTKLDNQANLPTVNMRQKINGPDIQPGPFTPKLQPRGSFKARNRRR